MTRVVLSCDPGAQKLACAVSVDRVVTWAGFVDAWNLSTLPGWMLTAADFASIELIVEKMIVRPGAAVSPAIANDLIDVHGSACWLATVLRPPLVRWIHPERWKGQLDKPQHHSLIWAAMTPAERGLFPADTGDYIDKACHRMAVKGGKARGYARESHNLLDAVALNLFHTGRTGVAGAPVDRAFALPA